MRPLGVANPAPVWGIRNVIPAARPKIVGGRHLKLLVASDEHRIEAIGFGMGDREVGDGPLDLAVNVRQNTYMGRNAVELSIKDFRPAVPGPPCRPPKTTSRTLS